MAIGFEDEFDYLDEEDSGTEDEFAPTIKGSSKPDLTPGADEASEEEVEEKEEAKVEEKEEEKKDERKFESSIFVVKVTTNKEDKALELISERIKKKKIETYAVARPHGLRGYIFLESKDKEYAEESVFNLPYVKGLVGKTVTYDEIKQMLEPVASDIKIEKGDIIEIIGEPFKNEKAKVVRVDKAKGEGVVSLLGAVVPIPVTVKLDNVRVVRRDEVEEE